MRLCSKSTGTGTASRQVHLGPVLQSSTVSCRLKPRLQVLRCYESDAVATTTVRTTIQRLDRESLNPTAALLASAFSEASNLQPYKMFLLGRIASYLQDAITRLREDCICFIAVAEPELIDDSGPTLGSESCELKPTPDVVGTVMLSFNESSREPFMLSMVKPPPDTILLTNMAVEPKVQRQGIATKLLEACEEFCSRHRPEKGICLHVRWIDTPALQLYEYAPYITLFEPPDLDRRNGYTRIRSDWGIVKLIGREPKYLLYKDVEQQQEVPSA